MKKIAFILLLACQFSAVATAAEWPNKPIKLTVAYGAGGTTDSTARLLSSFLEKELGTTVTVLNKPGGGGSVAATLAKSQRPDGYNIFTLVTGAAVITPHTQHLPYDPLKDLTLISRYAMWNQGIVAPKDAPYNTFKELVEYAKAHPGKVSYGISGTGTPQHLVMERLRNIAGVDWKAIPFKGGAAAVTALLGGHIDIMAGATEWLPQVRSGDFKLIAIITSNKMAEFPNVPTLQDLGFDLAAPSILGIAGPANMPKEIVRKLASAIEKASQKPEFMQLIKKLAMQVAYLDSQQFSELVKAEYKIQGDAIRQAGLGK